MSVPDSLSKGQPDLDFPHGVLRSSRTDNQRGPSGKYSWWILAKVWGSGPASHTPACCYGFRARRAGAPEWRSGESGRFDLTASLGRHAQFATSSGRRRK